MLGLTAWFLAGVGLSLIHFVLLMVQVSGLDPALAKRSVIGRVLGGYLVRYLSLAVVLTLAIRQSVSAGIAVAVGLWLARWVGVALGTTGRIDWSWLK